MFRDNFLFARTVGCFGCFGTSSTRTRQPPEPYDDNDDDAYSYSCDSDVTSIVRGEDEEDDEEVEQKSRSQRSEEILKYRLDNGLICRQVPVKETNQLIRGEDEDGNKMINEYVRVCKIGSGSYGKVVLYRSTVDGQHYAIKAFHKSHLVRLRVAPSETAMSDVLREVMIMKILEHPNIVNLIEVIDDPETDHFYMVLEYIDGKWVYDGSGPPGALGEKTARKYLRDIVAGLMYLHAHNVIHGDIKPDNLLVTSSGTVKIGDFSVSQVFKDDDDQLRRSPGTPVFTAPECCLVSGITYSGRAAYTRNSQSTLNPKTPNPVESVGGRVKTMSLDKHIEKVLFSDEAIAERVAQLGSEITSQFSGDSEPPVFVGVATGACLFLADLVRRIDLPISIDYIRADSYGSGTVSSGSPRISFDLKLDITNKHVFLVEDIVDTGNTLSCLIEHLKLKKASSVSVCTLLDKPSRRKVHFKLVGDGKFYSGFECPDEFVVGYGMDFAEQYRNLSYVGVLKPECYM